MFADQAIDFHGERGRESGPGGFDDDAVWRWDECGTKFEERGTQLANEVAADAAIQEFADAGDGGGRGELGVHSEVAEFVFKEGELQVGLALQMKGNMRWRSHEK